MVTWTGCWSDLTASAAEMEPTADRGRQSTPDCTPPSALYGGKVNCWWNSLVIGYLITIIKLFCWPTLLEDEAGSC